MAAEVLFVDDNKLILQASVDLFKAQGIELLTAGDAAEALELFREHEIAVVVSDNRMPGMSGLDFLSELRQLSPDTVKVLISSYVDLATALAAINNSEVFRYLLKPWKEQEILDVVREGLRRYRTVQAMRREDEAVLRSLAQTIELKDPSTKGHCDRVAVYALLIADAMGLSKDTLRQIKYGSWLHDCGKIGISEVILNGSGRLNDDEFETMKLHTDWGADLAEKARLSELAKNIIRHHHEKYDGTGYPLGLKGEEIPLEARIVSVADIYDALTMDRSYRKRYPLAEAREMVRSMSGAALDPGIVEVFLQVVPQGPLPSSEEVLGDAPLAHPDPKRIDLNLVRALA
ncbi:MULTISPECIES: HD-GYP domain-containing protein [Geomonas]|uniref:Response regulator n=1 Tax=Geomonas diazotrophica TaxID=2843197 RepID=A0ABX8JI80_9BACT|nr:MULTISPECIES: HD domain-containing phosphohydrolase [Geomonas]MBU5614319.1 response regulator [Geomonas azotofigens]MBU5635668.1 response regulator [Geomonas diazotrophica]QWV98090.1 response regulator [Geomonas nitrogeniifigens]